MFFTVLLICVEFIILVTENNAFLVYHSIQQHRLLDYYNYLSKYSDPFQETIQLIFTVKKQAETCNCFY
jgi:hypothetical protein